MAKNGRGFADNPAFIQSSEKIQHIQKTLLEKIRWLMTKEGTPILATIVAGFLLGFFVSGAIGVVLGTCVGLFILNSRGKLKIPTQPWQELVMYALPIVAKLCFLMVFFLPIADYLTLPTGHTPDTLMKYVSIMFVLPENFISGSPMDVFPGIPIVVLFSVVLMFWGSLNLQKRKNFNRAFGGLVLYTLSPTIASIFSGDFRIRFIVEFFSIGYYLAWIGLALIPIHRFVLPSLLKTQAPSSSSSSGFNKFLSITPLFMLTASMGDITTGMTHLTFDTYGGFLAFEALHHAFAGFFGGAIAGIGGGAIVSQIPELQTPEVSETLKGPQPSTDPNDVPGTTIEHNADGSVTKRLPDGTVATEYSDGTIYGEMPDGSKVTVYPDDTTKTVYPDGRTQTEYADGSSTIVGPDGATAKIAPDGTASTTLPEGDVVTVYPDGKVVLTTTGPDGIKSNFDANGKLISKTVGPNAGEFAGFSATYNPDNSFVLTSPYGGEIKVDANSNPIEGTATLEDGSVVTYMPDGTKQVTMEGDVMTYNPDGSVDVKGADGSHGRLNTDGSMSTTDADGSTASVDAQGNGHFEMDDGRQVTIGQDSTITVESPNGDSATLSADGSASFKGSDGETMQVNSDGSGSGTTADGTSWNQNADGSGNVKAQDGREWTVNSDGSGAFNAPDGTTAQVNSDGTGSVTAPDGSNVSLNADGSATVNEAGGAQTNLTAEQLKQSSPSLASKSENIGNQ